jgi:hypothetical protein
MLQGILQAAVPVGCYYKVLTGRAGPRFWAFCSWILVVFGRFLGVLILVPRRFLKRFIPGFSFLAFGSWALLVVALEVLGCRDSRRPLC